MAKNMTIKFKEVQNKKEELNTSATKIEELITKQDKLLASLVDESIWKGPTRDAVLDKKIEIKNNTKDIKELFNKYVTYLQEVVNLYKSLDDQLANQQSKVLNK